jgi:hypothetical protein
MSEESDASKAMLVVCGRERKSESSADTCELGGKPHVRPPEFSVRPLPSPARRHLPYPSPTHSPVSYAPSYPPPQPAYPLKRPHSISHLDPTTLPRSRAILQRAIWTRNQRRLPLHIHCTVWVARDPPPCRIPAPKRPRLLRILLDNIDTEALERDDEVCTAQLDAEEPIIRPLIERELLISLRGMRYHDSIRFTDETCDPGRLQLHVPYLYTPYSLLTLDQPPLKHLQNPPRTSHPLLNNVHPKSLELPKEWLPDLWMSGRDDSSS